MKKKYFIITIDNEEDNQWDCNAASTTENARYLQRFQELCNRYGFKPVYLTTYHMAKNPIFVKFAKQHLKTNSCEVGMHLHAWCSPPEYQLETKTNNRAYLIEYPYEIMEEKIRYLDKLLEDTFEQKIVSHRSGRWALNQQYIELLSKYGYLCDCSVTPGIDWSNHTGETGYPGSNYRAMPKTPYVLSKQLLEVPVSIRNLRYFDLGSIHSMKGLVREGYHLFHGKKTWIRPSNNSLYQMIKLAEKIYSEKTDYLMFMIHSSELMPGGSPYYPTEESIEKLYVTLEELFNHLSKYYQGVTLKEYYTKLHNFSK